MLPGMLSICFLWIWDIFFIKYGSKAVMSMDLHFIILILYIILYMRF